MKTIRIWLIVLLAILLPIRGAVAAGMLCGSGAGLHDAASGQTMVHAHGHDHASHHEHAGDEHADHERGAASKAANADGTSTTASSADACSLCAGCCSAAGIVSNLPVLAPSHVLNTVSFPSFAAAAPSFISGGLERPPRSI